MVPVEVVSGNKMMHRAVVEETIKHLWNGKRLERTGGLEYLRETEISRHNWEEEKRKMCADRDLAAVPLVDGIPCGVLFINIDEMGACIIVFQLSDLSMIRMFRVPIIPSAEALFRGTVLIGTCTMHRRTMAVYLWDWIAIQGHTAVNNVDVTFRRRQDSTLNNAVTVLAQTFENHPASFSCLPVLAVPFTSEQYEDAITTSSIPCVGLRFVTSGSIIEDGMQTWVWRRVFFVKMTFMKEHWMCMSQDRAYRVTKVFPKMEVDDDDDMLPSTFKVDSNTMEFALECTSEREQTFVLKPKQLVFKGIMSSVDQIEHAANACLRRMRWRDMAEFAKGPKLK
jgi:hypothetical protein